MPQVVDFRKPETFEEVALFLALEPDELAAAISAGSAPDNGQRLYIRHKIPKKNKANGQVRTVWDVADSHLRDAHRAFARRFGDFAQEALQNFPHPCAFGYIRGRCVKDNAGRHVGSRALLKCDLKDFFATIDQERLLICFAAMEINSAAARTLASFATIEGRLALGLNASPLLANIVCLELDHALARLAIAQGCAYTRYADDVTISGDSLPDIASVTAIVNSHGFQLCSRKTRITKRGQSHFVTGLSVSDSVAPHVPRPVRRRLRQELYFCKKFGLREHLQKIQAKSYQQGVNRIDGTVRFVAFVEAAIGDTLRKTWREILDADAGSVSYGPRQDQAGAEASLLFDEAEFERDGRRFLALCCVATERIEKIRRITVETLRSHLVDPHASGRKSVLEEKGLHFTDAPEDLRSKYNAVLPFLPFRAYIAFGEICAEENYGALYATLLGSLLPRRFMAHDRGTLSLYFEQNPRVPLASTTRLVSSIYRQLEERNDRRPIKLPDTSEVSKLNEPAISLPDSLLWTFCRYFEVNLDLRALNSLRFERVRDKYRHIVNIDTGEAFSRRHPLEAGAIMVARGA